MEDQSEADQTVSVNATDSDASGEKEKPQGNMW